MCYIRSYARDTTKLCGVGVLGVPLKTRLIVIAYLVSLGFFIFIFINIGLWNKNDFLIFLVSDCGLWMDSHTIMSYYVITELFHVLCIAFS